eukprot:4251635-Heterocapsa_arctica.AAC.1
MMEEEPAKTIETYAEMPSENMDKSKMTEEEMNNIADFVSQNQKTYLLKIEERLQGIEYSIAASKEMTEVCFKDIDNNFDTEHYCTKERFQEVMDCMKKMKNVGLEEEGTKTE